MKDRKDINLLDISGIAPEVYEYIDDIGDTKYRLNLYHSDKKFIVFSCLDRKDHISQDAFLYSMKLVDWIYGSDNAKPFQWDNWEDAYEWMELYSDITYCYQEWLWSSEITKKEYYRTDEVINLLWRIHELEYRLEFEEEVLVLKENIDISLLIKGIDIKELYFESLKKWFFYKALDIKNSSEENIDFESINKKGFDFHLENKNYNFLFSMYDLWFFKDKLLYSTEISTDIYLYYMWKGEIEASKYVVQRLWLDADNIINTDRYINIAINYVTNDMVGRRWPKGSIWKLISVLNLDINLFKTKGLQEKIIEKLRINIQLWFEDTVKQIINILNFSKEQLDEYWIWEINYPLKVIVKNTDDIIKKAPYYGVNKHDLEIIRKDYGYFIGKIEEKSQADIEKIWIFFKFLLKSWEYEEQDLLFLSKANKIYKFSDDKDFIRIVKQEFILAVRQWKVKKVKWLKQYSWVISEDFLNNSVIDNNYTKNHYSSLEEYQEVWKIIWRKDRISALNIFEWYKWDFTLELYNAQVTESSLELFDQNENFLTIHNGDISTQDEWKDNMPRLYIELHDYDAYFSVSYEYVLSIRDIKGKIIWENNNWANRCNHEHMIFVWRNAE